MDPTQIEKNELSDRESEILRLVATGASNKEIAQALFISANTVKVHLRNIFAKIGASSRTEAAMYAVKIGLVSGAPDLALESQEAGFPEASGARQSTRSRWLIGAGILVLVVLVGALVIAPRLGRSPEPTAGAPQAVSAPRWQARAPLPTARHGLALAAFEGALYAVGGGTEQDVTGVTERYDPASDSWQQVTSKPIPVSEIGAAVIGGKIYIPGGRQASGEVTKVLEIYDPRQDAWTQGAPLPTALSAYALVAFEGQLYLFGGWDGEKYLASIYVYDPGQDAWSAGPSMPTPRGYLGAAVSGRRIFVLGGYDGKSALTANEIFQPDLIGSSSNPWQAGEPLPEAKYAMGVTSVADLIYVTGGKGSSSSRYDFLVYLDPSSEWQSIESDADLARSGPGFTSLGVTLYAVGGNEGDVPTQDNLAYQAIFTLSFPIIIK